MAQYSLYQISNQTDCHKAEPAHHSSNCFHKKIYDTVAVMKKYKESWKNAVFKLNS